LPYIGNTPAEKYAAFNVQYFTTSATTSYTLDRAVANELDIRLVINNVIQEPGAGKAYTASGTTLTLSAATAGTDTMYAVYIGKAVQTVNPGAGSVGTTALADSSVTEAKLNVSNSPTNGYVLSAQSGATGGLTWAADAAGTITAFTNGVDNRLVTATSATALNGEADLTFDGTNLDLADNKKLRLGTGNDFEIYHDGSNSIIHDGGTGDLLIRAEDDLRLQDTSGYDYIHCNTDSSVELYHNKVKKLETASTGGIFTGLWSGGISQLIQAGGFPSGNATLSFSNVFNDASHSSGTTASYQMYILYFANVYSNAANKITLQIQTASGYSTGSIYNRVNFGRDTNGSTRTSEATGQDRANLQSTNANSSNWAARSGYIVFSQPGQASARKSFYGQITYFSTETNSPLTTEQFTGMADDGSNSMTGFRLETSTSTWAGGNYYLYGLKGSA